MPSWSAAARAWREGLGAPTAPADAAGAGFKGLPLRAGRAFEALGPGGGTVRFLSGANGPGGIAHGGAVVMAVVDACEASQDRAVRAVRMQLRRPALLRKDYRAVAGPGPDGKGLRASLEGADGKELCSAAVELDPDAAAPRRPDDGLDVEFDEVFGLRGWAPAPPAPPPGEPVTSRRGPPATRRTGRP